MSTEKCSQSDPNWTFHVKRRYVSYTSTKYYFSIPKEILILFYWQYIYISTAKNPVCIPLVKRVLT